MAKTPVPEWAPTGRPPMGQYRVTLLLTGDDLGPGALAWLMEKTASIHGHLVAVEQMERLLPDPVPPPL